eukprot:2235714-Pleurochrysis_carterae.AAC.1
MEDAGVEELGESNEGADVWSRAARRWLDGWRETGSSRAVKQQKIEKGGRGADAREAGRASKAGGGARGKRGKRGRERCCERQERVTGGKREGRGKRGLEARGKAGHTWEGMIREQSFCLKYCEWLCGRVAMCASLVLCLW